MKHKPTILFIGAFKPSGINGTTGGITYACKTLLDSPQSQNFNWILLDTTASTNNPRSFTTRSLHALKRLCLFIWYLLTRKPDKVAIFIGHGGSFYEKGLMALIAGKLSKPVILAPISGFIKTDLETSDRTAKFARKVFSVCETIVCQSESWRLFYRQYCSDSDKLKVVQNWREFTASLRDTTVFSGLVSTSGACQAERPASVTRRQPSLERTGNADAAIV